MHTHPSDRPAGHRRRRTDWREGGTTVRPWREMLLAWSLLGMGAGVLAGHLLMTLQPAAPWAGLAATGLLWLGLLVPVVLAFLRSRPAGLLRFRPVDLVLAAGFGLLLRFAQGAIQQAVEGQAPFPGILLVDGVVPASWWLNEAIPAAVVAPVLEEFFFRAVILVAVFTVLRRPVGHVAAGIAALLVSTALFVGIHLVGGTMTTDAVLSLTLVGIVTSALVLLTGRIWPAVLAHVVFNVSGLALALLGALAG